MRKMPLILHPFLSPSPSSEWKHDRRMLNGSSVVGCIFTLALVLPFSIQAAEPAKEKISVAYASISPSMSGIRMAKEIGAFERYGLNVDLIYISSGATAIQGFVGGSVQAA